MLSICWRTKKISQLLMLAEKTLGIHIPIILELTMLKFLLVHQQKESISIIIPTSFYH